MGQPVNYPDGSTLTSSALTLTGIGAVLQPLTMSMIGLSANPNSAAVRLQFPVQGQPFQKVSEDICYLTTMLQDDPYDKQRERTNLGAADPNLNEQWNYTRVWLIKWVFYGPNSLDLSRAVRSALYQDFFTNALASSQLFPMSEIKEPIRVPENIQGQWFERVDTECEMYEFVTETILRQTIATAEVIVSNDSGVIADITA